MAKNEVTVTLDLSRLRDEAVSLGDFLDLPLEDRLRLVGRDPSVVPVLLRRDLVEAQAEFGWSLADDHALAHVQAACRRALGGDRA